MRKACSVLTSTVHDQETLDPTDWPAFQLQAHAMLDDMLRHMQTLRTRPVWQAIPDTVRHTFTEALPPQGTALAQLHQRFLSDIVPYSVGNAHPGFMGWVQGGGTALGMLAEMLAAGLNANVGGRDQIPLAVEKQILLWMIELFKFPATANGLFVTGTSIANLIALLIARTARLGQAVREDGLTHGTRQLIAYTSAGAHVCVSQAMDLAGLGTHALRIIPVNAQFQIDTALLKAAIQADQAAGFEPFLIVGSAGTVDVGAVDDLTALANIADADNLWFHVDGAFGALGMLSPQVAPLLAGIELADSIAFDFHKWGQVPYDAGYILVRDGTHQLDTFAKSTTYLQRDARGMSAGSPWPCDLGPDLSRGFRALKTWFTIGTFGTEKLGRMIHKTCKLAQYLKLKIEQDSRLELLAPVSLSIVCFRYAAGPLDTANQLNADILIALQESGVVAPSGTWIGPHFALRAAIMNHRSTTVDIDHLIQQVLILGEQLRAILND
jgi:aromatic-L-amino-acid decarboxylase